MIKDPKPTTIIRFGEKSLKRGDVLFKRGRKLNNSINFESRLPLMNYESLLNMVYHPTCCIYLSKLNMFHQLFFFLLQRFTAIRSICCWYTCYDEGFLRATRSLSFPRSHCIAYCDIPRDWLYRYLTRKTLFFLNSFSQRNIVFFFLLLLFLVLGR